ncbi:hypothetical protein [uncultured Methanobrevibacter sp.]|uniref:hypothetical protein n=1 Tax=uncultured Methanobrevibacter sp. TaxID=253161 RepID=UPI0015BBAF6E|nr:hypothetical protein [uncultured Methanobrevibacter sp.]
MTTVKRLKSLDISSVTIMATTISLIFSIIISIIMLVVFGAISLNNIAIMAFIIPTLIFGTLIVSVYRNFIESWLYNLISKKTSIVFSIEEDGTVTNISTVSTALIIAIITTVMALIEYMVILFLGQLTLSAMVQTFMMTGQQLIAMQLYNLLLVVSNPLYVIGLIVGGFIISFIYVLIGTYIYNLIAGNNYGAKLNIKENSSLESIDVKSFAISISIIYLVLGLISGILSAITTGNYLEIAITPIITFILGFIVTAIIAWLYNVLAPKVGQIKFELIDE